MHIRTPEPHPTHSRTMIDEADIGSGEKSPGQHETEKMINDVPPLPGERASPAKEAAGDAQRGEQDKRSESDKHADSARAARAEGDAAAPPGKDEAAHGQVQREENRSRQDAGQE